MARNPSITGVTWFLFKTDQVIFDHELLTGSNYSPESYGYVQQDEAREGMDVIS